MLNISGWSSGSRMPKNNGPRTKLGYDRHHGLLHSPCDLFHSPIGSWFFLVVVLLLPHGCVSSSSSWLWFFFFLLRFFFLLQFFFFLHFSRDCGFSSFLLLSPLPTPLWSFFFLSNKKNDIFLEKPHTDYQSVCQSVWIIQIANSYGSYGFV